MKKLKHIFLMGFLVALIAWTVSAQTSHTVQMQVNEISAIATTGNPAALIITAPVTPGQVPQNASDSTIYLQYTSTCEDTKLRTVTANWAVGDVAPAGCELRLTGTPSGGLNEGNSSGEITLSTTAQLLVEDIGSCATGIGGADGALLGYVLAVATASDLNALDSETVTVTFTLTEDA